MISGGSENLSLKDKDATCSFVMPSLVVIRFLQSLAMGEKLYLTGYNNNNNNNNINNTFYFYCNLHLKQISKCIFCRFCAGDIDEHMDIFLDTQASKNAVIQAGTAIFQCIYHAPVWVQFDTACSHRKQQLG